MSQKRYHRRKSHPHSSHDRHHPQKRYLSQALENSILTILYRAQGPVNNSEIAQDITGKRSLSQELKAAITHLLHAKLIKKVEKKRLQLSADAPLYIGTLEQHPRKFGFVTTTSAREAAPRLTTDVYIAAGRMGNAMQGDIVLIRLLSPPAATRPEGVVLEIVERGPDTLAGYYRADNRRALVYPEDNRYPFIIEVPRDQYPHLENGNAVLVRIKPPVKPTRYISGSIIEVLGSPDNIDVQMRLVIEKFKLPHVFSAPALAEAAALKEPDTLEADRKDLRHIQHVTIDGETAKDFDDAVCVIKTEAGYRLYVSIADVSYYVKPDSPLDADAYQRGTSIYFPGRVIPMLPEELSNDLCSLVPDRDRLAVTAILDFDSDGKRRNKRFLRSVIRSHHRFTYTTVRHIVVDRDQGVVTEHAPFVEMLNSAAALAEHLQRRRIKRGSIGFSLPEAEISLDDEGRIATIGRAERNFAHQIIEEFMLAANEAVAETFTKNRRRSLYRIHELPDYEKVVQFSAFAKTLDLRLPPPETSPWWFGQVLSLCKGTPKEYIVNNLLLRTMQQARYSPENVGHFALAATDYTHFTSPIRRYPDLVVHRELCRLIEERRQKKTTSIRPQQLDEKGSFLSAREREAVAAEREMTDRLKLLYMEKHLGDRFTAIISGVNEFAFFVELLDLFISGAVPLQQLDDDYYLFDPKHHRVIGEISAKMYQIGDIIEVVATDLDRQKHRINFKPAPVKSSHTPGGRKAIAR